MNMRNQMANSVSSVHHFSSRGLGTRANASPLSTGFQSEGPCCEGCRGFVACYPSTPRVAARCHVLRSRWELLVGGPK